MSFLVNHTDIILFIYLGPTKEMINDFWRMIWQVDSGKIVMLANLTEDDKVKAYYI